MTDNEKLAKWQGLKQKPTYSLTEALYGLDSNVPDYLNDDAAAKSLLDTLVEKGCKVSLKSVTGRLWRCLIISDDVIRPWHESLKPTRRAAVCAAVLELIGKEDV